MMVRLKKNGQYWQAWWTTPDGQRKVKSLGARCALTRRDALARCQNLSVELGESDPRATDFMLGDWCVRFVKLRRSEWSYSTEQIYASVCKSLLSYFQSLPLNKLSKQDAALWRHKLSTNLADATVCKYIRCAKAICSEAVDQDLIPNNPFAKVRGTPRRVERALIKLNEATMAEAIDFSDRYKIWIALCWYAGLRKDEALRLRWEDVDWGGNRLLVNHEGEVTTKRRSRTVRVEPQLMRLLLDAYEWRTTPRVVNCPANAKVCPALRESLYTLGYVDKGVTLQALRRCRDTIWHQSYPAYVCAEWLGHSEEVARRHYLSIPELYYNEENENA